MIVLAIILKIISNITAVILEPLSKPKIFSV